MKLTKNKKINKYKFTKKYIYNQKNKLLFNIINNKYYKYTYQYIIQNYNYNDPTGLYIRLISINKINDIITNIKYNFINNIHINHNNCKKKINIIYKWITQDYAAITNFHNISNKYINTYINILRDISIYLRY